MEPKNSAAQRSTLAVMLFVSMILRLTLILRGGSRYLTDEFRYDHAVTFAHDVFHGKFVAAFSLISNHPEHAGYTIVMAPVAAIQAGIGMILNQPTHTLDIAPLIFTAVIATYGLYLVYLLARRLGEDHASGCYAAGILLVSSSWNGFANHLLPYDIGLTLILGAAVLLIGRASSPHANGPRVHLAVGALLSSAFLVYNGYWGVVATLGLFAVFFRGPRNLNFLLLRGVQLGAGFLIPLLIVESLSIAGGGSMLVGLRSFSQTITQGDWNAGTTLLPVYLFHLESGLSILWLVWFCSTLYIKVRKGTKLHRVSRGCILLISGYWLVLALASDLLHLFVVYGRSIRPVLPLFALGCGIWLSSRATRLPIIHRVVVILLVAQLLSWWIPALRVTYPREEWNRLQQSGNWPEIGVALSWSGPAHHPPVDADPNANVVFYNYRHLYPLENALPLPPGKELWKAPHPAGQAIFRFEGYTRRDRALLREHPPLMLLIEHDTLPRATP